MKPKKKYLITHIQGQMERSNEGKDNIHIWGWKKMT